MRNLIAAMWILAAAPAFAQAPAWRPVPATDAVEPSQTIAEAPAEAWQDIPPENLLLIDLASGQRVAIELAPLFAPVHVANIRAFARSGYWHSPAIYRVQDNYVVQWGNGEEEGGQAPPLPQGVVALPPAEYGRPLQGLSPRPLGFPDAYAPLVGHAGGWPLAWDPESGRAWLPHCYGTVGVARDLAPDTGSGAELYAVSGHAPRQLDRNIATVGRVIEGFEHMTANRRGSEALGFIGNRVDRVPIARISMAADLPEGERPAFQSMRTDSASFAAYVKGRANRGGPFFAVQAGGVDVCNAPVPVRRRP